MCTPETWLWNSFQSILLSSFLFYYYFSFVSSLLLFFFCQPCSLWLLGRLFLFLATTLLFFFNIKRSLDCNAIQHAHLIVTDGWASSLANETTVCYCFHRWLLDGRPWSYQDNMATPHYQPTSTAVAGIDPRPLYTAFSMAKSQADAGGPEAFNTSTPLLSLNSAKLKMLWNGFKWSQLWTFNTKRVTRWR